MNKNFSEDDLKSNIGKIFFAVSVLLGIYLFFSPISNVLIHIDEWWTVALIKTSFLECLKITIKDVHPPLYYMIVQTVCYVLNALHIQYDLISVLKIISFVPYFIVLGISATKIRKEYGWLTVGIFTFSIIAMSFFFRGYSTIRMYSWSLLFLLMSFLYFRQVIAKSDRKSWALFILFTLLGAYTHYFVLVTSALMYLMLFIRMFINKDFDLDKKEELKKWLVASISTVILYAPWIFVLMKQVSKTMEYQKNFPHLYDLFSYVSWFAVNSTTDFSYVDFGFRILAILFLVFMIIIFVKQSKSTDFNENYFISSGFILYLLTLAIGVTAIVLTYKPLVIRYLIPVISLLWLSCAIVIGKIKDRKILVISIILVLLLGAYGLAVTYDTNNQIKDDGSEMIAALDKLNNDSNVIVFNQDFLYVCYHDYVDNAKLYATQKDIRFDYKLDDVKSGSNLTTIMKENHGKKVYMIDTFPDKNFTFENNITGKKVYKHQDMYFLKLS